jgi:hypothetical protein
MLLAACSHTEAGTSGYGGDDATPMQLVVSRVRAEPPSRWPQRYPTHFIDLPAGGVAIAAGDGANDDHPAGTLYVVEGRGTGWGIALAEWDLATGAVLQRQPLPFAPGGYDTRVLHQGERVDLVARGPGVGNTYYALLDTSFRVLSRTRLAKLDGTLAQALASDGTLTLVVGDVPSLDGAGGYEGYAATFNALGKPVAEREIPYEGSERMLVDCAVVVQGTPYILRFQGESLRLHQLTTGLEEVVSSIVPTGRGTLRNLATLWVRGDRLVVDAPPQQFEFTLDLTQMREVPRQPPLTPHGQDEGGTCWKSATLGPVYALLCPADSARHSVPFIAWDRADP